MDYEYVALQFDDDAEPWCERRRAAEKCRELLGFGWKEWRTIAWSGLRVGGVRVFRRSRERDIMPKDEPRMWTEGEIRKIAVMSQPGPRADGGWLGPPLLGSVLNERVMRADLIGRLERRNEELQTAIDEVYATSKKPDNRGISTMTLRAVRRCLRPLATKEETNG